jgi:hypothetical protein
MIKLTKQAVARLFASPIRVAVVNGCFKLAEVTASFSRYRVELRVEVGHPTLDWQCGCRQEVTLLYCVRDDGRFIHVPDELEPLVEKLRKAATITDEEAQRIGTEYAIAAADLTEKSQLSN